MHTHDNPLLLALCLHLAVDLHAEITVGPVKSSQRRKRRHFQLNGGLKADRPGNSSAGRKSAPVSRHGSHAGTSL